MDEENNDEKIKKEGKKIKGFIGDAIKVFSPVLIIAIIVSIILIAAFKYIFDIDTANFKDKDESNVPFNFLKYYSGINISQDGKITTKLNAQEIWDNIIKNDGNVDEYLDDASELKRLMDAQIVTQFPDTRPNPDEKVDWDKLFSYSTEFSNTNTYNKVDSNSAINVLFIGNSRTKVNDVPSLFSNLATSLGKSVNVGVCAKDAKPLSAFLDESSIFQEFSNKVKEKKWDYVVLQEQTETALSSTSVKTSVTRILDYIKQNSNKDIKAIYKAWGVYYDFNEAQYNQATQSFEAARAENGGNIAYIANALLKCHEVHPTINLYTDDRHATMEGSYLATCCVYSAIFGEATEGASYTSTCDSRIANLLQQISDDVMNVSKSSTNKNNASSSKKQKGSLTSEIQGIVKFKRAKADGSKTTMTYVDESTFNFYMNEYMRTGSEEDKQRALNVFTIGKTPGTKSSSNSGVGLAGFTAEDFLQAVRNVAADVYENRNIYRYGDSKTLPPCDWQVIDGQKVKLMACNRLVSKAVYDLGLTDMEPGGSNVTSKEWFSAHGFVRIDEQSELQAGDIIIFGHGKGTDNENWLHTFVLESYDHSTQTCSKYDMGSQERMYTKQPFINVPFDEWNNQDFICGYRVNESFTNGLGERRDITASTLDKNGNNLLSRMNPSLKGSSYSDLSYLIIPHYNFQDKVELGEMVVNKEIADEVLLIFQELFNIKYPIEEMKLVDEYGADDWTSIQHNNTSAFNYRTVDGSSNLSNHALGKAIDINPLVNPYIFDFHGGTPYTKHHPDEGKDSTNHNSNYNDKFIDRNGMHDWTDVEKRARITRNDEIYSIFAKYGWTWLEYVDSNIDSQHFEKTSGESKTIDWSKVSTGSANAGSNSGSESRTGSRSGSGSNSSTPTQTPFIKYELTDQELTGLTAVAYSEQGWGNDEGAAAEASIMANLYELHYSKSYSSLYSFVASGKWFDRADTFIDSGYKYDYDGHYEPVTEEEKAIVKSVLVDGKRTLPGYVDEHASTSLVQYITTNGVEYDDTDKSKYIPHVTIVHQPSSSYIYYGHVANSSDPFGYTSRENRERIGDFHYDFNSGNGIGDSNGENTETTYYVKVATWSETITNVEYTEPGKEGYTTIENHMSAQKINYQDFLSGYTMPFNYLWALLVITEDKDFVMDLADLVYNSEIEITIHDNFTETHSENTESYWSTIYVAKGKDSNGKTIYGPERAMFEKITKITYRNNTIKADLTRANVWIVDYKHEYEFNGHKWIPRDKDIKEKTDKNSKDPNFVTLLRKHRVARTALNEAASWLFEVIEEPDNGITDMLDLTKYLLYKATGTKYDGIEEYDFGVYDPDTFKKTNSQNGVVSYSSINITPEEMQILYKITSAERGDGTQQQQEYVVSVILNRVLSSEFPSSVKDVVYQKSQFTAITDGNYDRANPSETTKAAVDNVIKTGDKSQCAVYFMTPRASIASRNHSWVSKLTYLFNDQDESLKSTNTGGSHNFYTKTSVKTELQQYMASGNEIVAEAQKYVGNPYVWGGNSLTNGCDCSHFIRLILIQLGKIPPSAEYHTTADMDSGRLRDWGAEDIGTDPSLAQAGDIILYGSSHIHHVAFYDGNGLIVEAQSSNAGITNNRTLEHEGIAAIFRVK